MKLIDLTDHPPFNRWKVLKRASNGSGGQSKRNIAIHKHIPLGTSPSEKRKHTLREQPSSVNLDRVDSNKGYSKDNCVVCCYICNKMKSTLSEEQFLVHIREVLKWQAQKQ